MMMPPRVYTDTSVYGGPFDPEFQTASRRFFKGLREKRFVALISDALIEEAERAPTRVKELLAETIKGGAELLEVTQEAVELRDAYLRAGVLSPNYDDDALHVALATLARADAIVSWNFRHLVNPARIRGFNGVNMMRGYGPVVILSPDDFIKGLEVSGEEDEEEV